MRGRGAPEDVFRVRIVLIRGTIAYNTELLDRIRVEFQYLRGIKKQFDDFNIFTKILSRSAQWRSCFALTFSCEREAG